MPKPPALAAPRGGAAVLAAENLRIHCRQAVEKAGGENLKETGRPPCPCRKLGAAAVSAASAAPGRGGRGFPGRIEPPEIAGIVQGSDRNELVLVQVRQEDFLPFSGRPRDHGNRKRSRRMPVEGIYGLAVRSDLVRGGPPVKTVVSHCGPSEAQAGLTPVLGW